MIKVHQTFCGDVRQTWEPRTLDAAVKRARRMVARAGDGWGAYVEAPAAELVSVGDGGHILPARFGDAVYTINVTAEDEEEP